MILRLYLAIKASATIEDQCYDVTVEIRNAFGRCITCAEALHCATSCFEKLPHPQTGHVVDAVEIVAFFYVFRKRKLRPSVKLGFIGIGAISEHVITGLIQHGGHDEIVVVSERSRHRSSRLVDRFTNVEVESDNQTIVDRVDVVFVGTLPQQTLDLLDTLVFREDQIVVSMAAIVSVEQIAEKVIPASRIHRIIPMPPNEMGVGPIPIYPPSSQLTELLSRIGTVIPVEDQQQFSTFSASSALMATFFELVATNARWIQSRGVEPEVACKYSTALFHSLATQSKDLGAAQLESLSTDCLTVGGLNEQVLNATKHEGWFSELEVELDKILKRISD